MFKPVTVTVSVKFCTLPAGFTWLIKANWRIVSGPPESGVRVAPRVGTCAELAGPLLNCHWQLALVLAMVGWSGK